MTSTSKNSFIQFFRMRSEADICLFESFFGRREAVAG